MKGKKITGAAILLFAGLALVLYFLKKDPLREVHVLWEETMSRTEGAYVQTVTGSAWETKDAPGSENGERPGGTESSTAVTKVWYGTDERGFWYRMELFQKEKDGSLTLLHIMEEDAGGRTMQLAGYPDKSPMEPSVKEGETLSLKTLLGGLWTEPAETKVQKVEKYQEDHGLRYVIRHKVLQSVFPGTEGKEMTGTINRTDTVRTGPDGTVKEFVIQADSVYDVYEEMGAVVEYRIEFFSGDEAGNMELGSGTGPSE